eukprot:6847887-Karenia_brevis.AAC.1
MIWRVTRGLLGAGTNTSSGPQVDQIPTFNSIIQGWHIKDLSIEVASNYSMGSWLALQLSQHYAPQIFRSCRSLLVRVPICPAVDVGYEHQDIVWKNQAQELHPSPILEFQKFFRPG